MDISEFEVSDDFVAEMIVYDPRDRTKELTHKDKPVTISLVGLDSQRVRDAARRARVKTMMEKPLAAGPMTVDDGANSLAKAEKRDLETLAAATVGWYGIGLGKDEDAFTPELCAKIYGKSPWLVEQVNAFLGNRANFMPASRKV